MSNFCLDIDVSSLCKKYGSVMLLKLFVNCDGVDYVEHIQKHNTKVFSDKEPFFDSGFDLFYPVKDGYVCSGGGGRGSAGVGAGAGGIVNKIDFQVKCSATMIHNYATDCKDEAIREYVTGYMLFPRSSLSKTSLRLANSVGVIDSGYRGNIIGMFDCLSENYEISYMDRLVQICAPTMCPIYVQLVEKEEDLGVNTSRGDGGFGK